MKRDYLDTPLDHPSIADPDYYGPANAPAEPVTPPRLVLMEEAVAITLGDRNDKYGDPLPNHENIAGLWSIYLGYPIRAEQAAVMMALTKIARMICSPGHRDHYRDGVNYLAIAGEIVERLDLENVDGNV